MLSVLVVTFPFFALVLCGYVATRGGMLPQPAIPGLNAFVLYFALPALLFRFGATTPIAQFVNGPVVGLYVACASIMVAFNVAVARFARSNWNDAAFSGLSAAFPNTGYMGVPLLVALFGARAAGPSIVTILIDLIFTSSLCIALSRLGGAGRHGAAPALRHALKGVLANPMPWAILIGVATYAAAIELPAPLMQTIGLMADAASPVALFTIGAMLARSRMTALRRTPWAHYLPAALMKLVLHPLLVLVLGTSAIELGVPLDRFSLTILVLVAALPSASNVAVLAERFGADNGRVARIILVSTASAFVTFSGAVALMT